MWKALPLMFCTFLWVGHAHAVDNRRAGRTLAIDACSACHQVTADQKPRPPVFDPDEYRNVVPPSFAAIAAKYSRRPWALRRFILLPRHPMPEQNWDPADLTAVVAFILAKKMVAPTPRPNPSP